MKRGKKLLILPAVAVLLGMGTGCSDNSGNKAQDIAQKALMASVDNPESVKIVGISKPDSVFGREYVTMKEKIALSVAIMKISRRFMERFSVAAGDHKFYDFQLFWVKRR